MRVVTSVDEVARNIRTYMDSVARHPELAARIKQHTAWYAIRERAGEWQFGPSKFVGYHAADAVSYLASYSRKDGKETEPTLSKWFEQVDPDSALGLELRQSFAAFAENHGKTPNSRWRVSVTQEELESRGARRAQPGGRIAFDSEICGGRPRIAGTRVRVSDIVMALADGASVPEILVDYPYLAAEDISAALGYAAQAVDHRVLRAA